MPLKHKENVLTTIEDMQRLASKDLKYTFFLFLPRIVRFSLSTTGESMPASLLRSRGYPVQYGGMTMKWTIAMVGLLQVERWAFGSFVVQIQKVLYFFFLFLSLFP